MSLGQSVLHLRNVGFGYLRSADLLRDVSFSLSPGTLNLVTGPAGAGKSTLLRLCDGREKSSRGAVYLFGTDVGTVRAGELAAMRRRLGLVFQTPRFLDHMSAFDNVALPLRLARKRRADYSKDVQELLAWAGLAGREQQPAGSLSASERQRVAIARALVGKPDLLLADEPFANLDDEAGQRMIRILLNIHRFGTTVLIATGNSAAITGSGGRELRLAAGRIGEMDIAA
ncbi:MAG TPA: ATP-binding cassette domain-containing protein [Micropepsaceae bacterium]|nr:ATP-binding cassette domain-containing protein [Micropepsaceae bacterium]